MQTRTERLIDLFSWLAVASAGVIVIAAILTLPTYLPGGFSLTTVGLIALAGFAGVGLSVGAAAGAAAMGRPAKSRQDAGAGSERV